MSLEKFLLTVASVKTEGSKENLKLFFDYLLHNSNNVAIHGVLTSVAIAYPEEVDEGMIPLISTKEFYKWDLNRSLKEGSALAPQDNKIYHAQEERYKSNQLPHRKKFDRGLGGFVIDYQFSIKKLNEQIHKRFDKLKGRADENDVIWKKWLNEIDVRTWEIKEFDKDQGRVVIQPKYEDAVNNFLESGQEEYKAQNTAINYSGLISRAYENKEKMSFRSWQECYEHYSNSQNTHSLFDHPISLAVIGLRDFASNLSEDEKLWCLKTVIESVVSILQNEFHRSFDGNTGINPLEREIALSSFHLTIDHVSDDDKNSIIGMMIYMLFAPFADHELDAILKYVRDVFFKHYPAEGKRVWAGLIHYAEFRKSNPYYYDHFDQNKEEVLIREQKLIEVLSSTADVNINFDEIDFKNCEGYLLARAVAITPYYYSDEVFAEFIEHFIPLFVEDLQFEWDYSHGRNKKARHLHHEAIHDLEHYFSDLLLHSDSNVLPQKVIELLFNKEEIQRGPEDLREFLPQVLEYVAIKLFDLMAVNQGNGDYSKQLNNFWHIWQFLLAKTITTRQISLLPTLFLNMRHLLYDFKGNAADRSWKALENSWDFYRSLISEFGDRKISKYVIDLFSTVGETPFLPTGLNWLRELLEKSPQEINALATPSGERLIKKLFYNHISAIKSDKQLINNFIWILDKMVELESSQAYLFRENVISFKSVN